MKPWQGTPFEAEYQMLCAGIDREREARQSLAAALSKLLDFIGESLERRSMDSVALEARWHAGHQALRRFAAGA